MLAAVGAILYLALASGRAASIIKTDSDSCNLGAQYWCSSTTAADLCGKTEWCAKNYWSNNLLQLTSNEVAIVSVEDCKVLQDEQQRSQCEEYYTSKDILQKLIELVHSHLEQGILCGELKLCGPFIPSVKHEDVAVNHEVTKAKPFCRACTIIMQKLDSFLSANATEKQIETALGIVCDFVPVILRYPCKIMIAKYTPVLVNLTLRYPPKEVCGYLKLCSANTDDTGNSVIMASSVLPVKQDLEFTPVCLLCELVVKQLENVLVKNATQQQIMTALGEICGLLPSTLRHECNDFILQYLPVFVELLQHFPPEKLCQYSKLCSVQAIQISSLGVTDPLLEQKIQSAETNDAKCTVCKLVIQKVKSMVNKGSSRDKIKAVLEKVCQLLTPVIRSPCKKFIDKYEPVLIDLLLSSFTPEQICAKLKLCKKEVLLTEAVTPNVNDIGCFLCKLIMGQVTSILSNNATQSEIKAALGKICHKLSPPFDAMCNNFINEYEEQIIQLLLSKWSPDQICKQLRFCSADFQGPPSEHEIQSPERNDAKCTVCKLVIQKVKSMVNKGSSRDEIKAVLEKVCQLMTPVIRSPCKKLIDKYEPVLIDLLLSSFTPEQICAKLKLCKKSKEVLLTEADIPNVNDVGCFLCKLIMGQVTSILSNNATQSEIKTALGKMCHKLSPPFEAMCNNFINEYEEQIIQLLLSKLSPDQICKQLRFCSADFEAKTQSLMFVTENNKGFSATPVREYSYCSACTFALFEAHSALDDPLFQNEWRTVLHKFCTYLETDLDVCSQQMDVGLNGVIDGLKTFLHPTDFCQQIELCGPPDS